MARCTSWSRTSRCPASTATTPRLFCEVMWPPAIPTTAELIGTPDICSAMSTASATASAARSISTTAPLRTPREATRPTPRTWRPVGSRSATAQQTLVVPRSSAKTRRGRVTVSVSECSRHGCAIQGFSGAKPQDAGFAPPVCHNMLVVLERSDGRSERPFASSNPEPGIAWSPQPWRHGQGLATAPSGRGPVRRGRSGPLKLRNRNTGCLWRLRFLRSGQCAGLSFSARSQIPRRRPPGR